MMGDFGLAAFRNHPLDFPKDQFHQIFPGLIDQVGHGADDGRVKVAVRSGGQGAGSVKDPVKRGVEESGDQVAGEGAVRPKVDAQNGAGFEHGGQLGGAVDCRDQLGSRGPWHRQNHDIVLFLRAVLEFHLFHLLVNFIVLQFLHR